jgi:cobalt-zinc-cadmium efflux system outer membrane protein
LQRLRLILLAIASVPLACTAPPDVRTVDRIAAATGGAAVVFSVAGEPVDAPESPEVLTMVEAVRLGVLHSPALQASLARVRQAMAQAEQSRLLPNPILSVVVRFPEAGGRVNVEASLAADVVSMLWRHRRMAGADQRLWAASADAVNTALDVVQSVQERFVAMQMLEAEHALLLKRRELVRVMRSIVQSRVDAGEAPRPELTSVDAELVEVETELLEKESAILDERLALARLLGRPTDEAKWTIEPWPLPELPDRSESQWIEAAMKHRPELAMRRWQLAALGSDAAVAGWPFGEESELSLEAERDGGDWSAGPGVSIPLPFFDWGQARRAEIEAQLAEVRHQLTEAQRQVVEDVRRALAGLAGARASLRKLDEELIPLLQRRQEQTEASYRAGETDITTLIQAEQQLRSAQLRRVDLQRRLALHHIRLVRVSGGVRAIDDVGKQP